MSFTSSGDEEESEDEDDLESEIDIESWKGVETPLTRLYKKHIMVSAKKVSPNETVAFIPCVHLQMYDGDDSVSDESQNSKKLVKENEIATQELPNKQDFGGTEALDRANNLWK
jgi:hypothetical protein